MKVPDWSAQKIWVLDGPLATELERRGRDLKDPLWSAKLLMNAPELIREVHLDHYRAGADVVITASYQASIEGFMRHGLSKVAAAEHIYKAVSLAREARTLFEAEAGNLGSRPRPLVAGSIGSYGAFLADGSEYQGRFALSKQQLMDFHRPRLAILCDRDRPGVDFLAMETIPSLKEAQALTHLLKEYPWASAWMSFSARDGTATSAGEPIEAAAAWLDEQPQIHSLGINCTPPKYIAPLLRNMRTATTKPLVIYPNSGESYLATKGRWKGEPDMADVSQLEEWRQLGARLIGGCCRTTLSQLSQIAAWRAGL